MPFRQSSDSEARQTSPTSLTTPISEGQLPGKPPQRDRTGNGDARVNFPGDVVDTFGAWLLRASVVDSWVLLSANQEALMGKL